jgi:predicted kinase
MSKLIIIRGLCGSGKTTYAKQLLAEGKVQAHFEADMYFENVTTGEYMFDQTKLGLAHDFCYVKTTQALEEGKNVAVANTFTRHGEMKHYITYCKAHGHEVETVVMTGDYGSVHNVPPETLEKMRNRWQD